MHQRIVIHIRVHIYFVQQLYRTLTTYKVTPMDSCVGAV